MSIRYRLTFDLFIVVFIRNNRDRTILRNMIKFYRQEIEVTFRSSLESKKCRCTIERNRKINEFVNLLIFLRTLLYTRIQINFEM